MRYGTKPSKTESDLQLIRQTLLAGASLQCRQAQCSPGFPFGAAHSSMNPGSRYHTAVSRITARPGSARAAPSENLRGE